MKGFSEEELLVLNNYIYFNCSGKYASFGEALDAYSSGGKSGSRRFDPESFKYDACAGLSEEDAKDVFTRLDKMTAEGGSMEGLSVERILDEGGVRAMCVKKPSGEAAVIFRGTGGTYEAWLDNVRGEFVVDTHMQKMASDFVKYNCGEYSDLTVSGHSKGGNLAQFVTVACAEQIARCVSFDGQGFNREFINEHKEEVEKARDKITSVCANNDYVNILLNSIAGETVYIRNKDHSPVGAHCSYSLLKYGQFDEEGNAKRYKLDIQTPFIKAMKTTIDGIVGAVDLLPENGNEKISELLGSIVGTIFCCEKETNKVDEWQEIKDSAMSVYSYARERLGIYDPDEGAVRLYTENIYEDFDRLASVAGSLENIRDRFSSGMENVYTIREELNTDIIADVYLSVTMDRVNERMGRDLKGLHNIINGLYDILNIYRRKEEELTGLVGLQTGEITKNESL
ncbi:MAG: DUF2974 domain-containing protein [Lachnospiraceae bacterium]|nr:DUF2974 domain-containing protein [Lachnospiraceae bacterium]